MSAQMIALNSIVDDLIGNGAILDDVRYHDSGVDIVSKGNPSVVVTLEVNPGLDTYGYILYDANLGISIEAGLIPDAVDTLTEVLF